LDHGITIQKLAQPKQSRHACNYGLQLKGEILNPKSRMEVITSRPLLLSGVTRLILSKRTHNGMLIARIIERLR